MLLFYSSHFYIEATHIERVVLLWLAMKRIQVYLKQAYRKSWSALTFSEMIMELNSVLVPDEEIAQIHDFARILKEAKAERDAEQARTQEILDRM